MVSRTTVQTTACHPVMQKDWYLGLEWLIMGDDVQLSVAAVHCQLGSTTTRSRWSPRRQYRQLATRWATRIVAPLVLPLTETANTRNQETDTFRRFEVKLPKRLHSCLLMVPCHFFVWKDVSLFYVEYFLSSSNWSQRPCPHQTQQTKNTHQRCQSVYFERWEKQEAPPGQISYNKSIITPHITLEHTASWLLLAPKLSSLSRLRSDEGSSAWSSPSMRSLLLLWLLLPFSEWLLYSSSMVLLFPTSPVLPRWSGLLSRCGYDPPNHHNLECCCGQLCCCWCCYCCCSHF